METSQTMQSPSAKHWRWTHSLESEETFKLINGQIYFLNRIGTLEHFSSDRKAFKWKMLGSKYTGILTKTLRSQAWLNIKKNILKQSALSCLGLSLILCFKGYSDIKSETLLMGRLGFQWKFHLIYSTHLLLNDNFISVNGCSYSGTWV